jgi:hypothetical protein
MGRAPIVERSSALSPQSIIFLAVDRYSKAAFCYRVTGRPVPVQIFCGLFASKLLKQCEGTQWLLEEAITSIRTMDIRRCCKNEDSKSRNSVGHIDSCWCGYAVLCGRILDRHGRGGDAVSYQPATY